jgi:transcription antitermination factor NusG
MPGAASLFDPRDTRSLPSSPLVAEVEAVIDQQHRWCALLVRARHEKTTQSALTARGLETFLPLYSNRHTYGNRTREFRVPLFPGYVFCRFMLEPEAGRMPEASSANDARTLSEGWSVTKESPLRGAGTGRAPMPVDERELAAIRVALSSPFTITPHHYVRVGRRGRVLSGPLAGIEGIVIEVKGGLRLILSITSLERSIAVDLDYDQVSLG